MLTRYLHQKFSYWSETKILMLFHIDFPELVIHIVKAISRCLRHSPQKQKMLLISEWFLQVYDFYAVETKNLRKKNQLANPIIFFLMTKTIDLYFLRCGWMNSKFISFCVVSINRVGCESKFEYSGSKFFLNLINF